MKHCELLIACSAIFTSIHSLLSCCFWRRSHRNSCLKWMWRIIGCWTLCSSLEDFEWTNSFPKVAYYWIYLFNFKRKLLLKYLESFLLIQFFLAHTLFSEDFIYEWEQVGLAYALLLQDIVHWLSCHVMQNQYIVFCELRRQYSCHNRFVIWQVLLILLNLALFCLCRLGRVTRHWLYMRREWHRLQGHRLLSFYKNILKSWEICVWLNFWNGNI